MSDDVGIRLDAVKKIFAAMKDRREFADTKEFGDLPQSDQLAHLMVTKVMMDVLGDEIDSLAMDLNISTDLLLPEQKLAKVIDIFDGNHRERR